MVSAQAEGLPCAKPGELQQQRKLSAMTVLPDGWSVGYEVGRCQPPWIMGGLRCFAEKLGLGPEGDRSHQKLSKDLNPPNNNNDNNSNNNSSYIC